MDWQDLLYYWRGHHVDGKPPSRADIDPPLEQPQLLPNLLLLQAHGDSFRVRLVGSEVTRRAGADMTGLVLDPLRADGQNVPDYIGFLRKVVATKAPLLYSVGRTEETAFGAIGLLLPLVEPSGEVDIILGGLFYDSGPGRTASTLWRPGALTELALADELARRETVGGSR